MTVFSYILIRHQIIDVMFVKLATKEIP